MPALQRHGADALIAWVTGHKVYRALREDIDAGAILPCLRKDEIHIYEGGARLLTFSARAVYTHVRYTGSKGNGYVKLPDDLCPGALANIRKTARQLREERGSNELATVHRLFKEFAATRLLYQPGELALVDVEIRFGPHETDPTLPTKMIDLAFLMPDARLLFVEAKCIGNAAISSTTIASVVTKQVQIYERHIQRAEVLPAMNLSLCAQARLAGRFLRHAIGIFPRVPVLVLNPAGRPVTRNNHWLRQALDNASKWTGSSADVAIIDSRSDPADAIRAFASKFGSPAT